MHTRHKDAATVLHYALTGLLFAGLFTVASLLAGQSLAAQDQQQPDHTYPVQVQPTHVQQIVDSHDCWTGDAPADMAGQLPGGVVVMLPGHRAAFHDDDATVGAALDHALGNDHGKAMEVHAFCR